MGENLVKGAMFAEIREFLAKVKRDYNSEYQVVFLTSSGKIVCDLGIKESDDSAIGLSDDPTMIDVDISAIFKDTFEFDKHLVNAMNVVVYKNDSEEEFMRSDQMLLFTDHIMGVSLVRKE